MKTSKVPPKIWGIYKSLKKVLFGDLLFNAPIRNERRKNLNPTFGGLPRTSLKRVDYESY